MYQAAGQPWQGTVISSNLISSHHSDKEGSTTNEPRWLWWLGRGGDVADNHLSLEHRVVHRSLYSRPAVKDLDGCQERHLSLLFLAASIGPLPPPPCSIRYPFPLFDSDSSRSFPAGVFFFFTVHCFVCRLPAFPSHQHGEWWKS